MLKPIRPKRFSDLVFEQIRDLIFKGRLKPGDQLMTERELAESMGVSRPTVREAINKLVALRLLEHRKGQGTFVSSPAGEAHPLGILNGRDVSLSDLLEVRLGLECNAVMMAARRATEEDIRGMEQCLDDMESEIQAGGLGSNTDVAFHMAVAYSTRNIIQIHIMKSFYDLLFHGIKENLEYLYSEPSTLAITLQHHKNIFQAIRDRNPEAAYEAMREHITFVLKFIEDRKLAKSGSILKDSGKNPTAPTD